MAKGKTDEKLFRVAKFPIYPTEEQIAALRKISDNLWKVWDHALGERQKAFVTHIAPLYEELKVAVSAQDIARTKEVRAHLKAAYTEHMPTLFDQINALTALRRNTAYGSVTRNWQEETLDTLDGAYKSFVQLRKNGDYDARPPKMRSAWHFSEIPGRSGFSIGDGYIAFSTKHLPAGLELRFPIPQYQQGELSRGTRVKKFTLYRTPRDMREEGRWWVSVAYELPMPETVVLDPRTATYISLGASSIGVVSPRVEMVIDLWRPDKHWKPKIEDVSERMKRCTKGSRQWKKLNESRRTMFRLMAEQQKLNHRELVARLIREHGVHFVVQDMVVRSKKGKLADAAKVERGGSLGLNWQAQNTGSIAAFVAWLTIKAEEYGGSVRKCVFTPPETDLGAHDRKILFARTLREQFLASI